MGSEKGISSTRVGTLATGSQGLPQSHFTYQTSHKTLNRKKHGIVAVSEPEQRQQQAGPSGGLLQGLWSVCQELADKYSQVGCVAWMLTQNHGVGDFQVPGLGTGQGQGDYPTF